MSAFWRAAFGTLEGILVSTAFLLALFIGFCVLFNLPKLKPRGKGEFGTTNEWRHYNALYYPYIVGLKPYSLRATNDELDENLQEVARWFNTNVPERTLYNWQTAATKLVAQDLRERQPETESV